MKSLTFTFILSLSFTLIFAQDSKKSKRQIKADIKAQKIQLIKSIIDSKTFVFKAYSVIPSNEKVKTLTSDFGIEVRIDSIFSYMPYFGNAYSRDYTSFKDSPMGFAQPMDSYKKLKTKSGYDIEIKVNNLNDVIELTFHISKTGDASVVASSLNRQSISYVGEIFAPKADE
ncbi:DUF4251 domain-containing protein [Draconibacterium sp.]